MRLLEKIIKGACLEQLSDALAKLDAVSEPGLFEMNHLMQQYQLCVLREAAESVIHVDAAVDGVSMSGALGIPNELGVSGQTTTEVSAVIEVEPTT